MDDRPRYEMNLCRLISDILSRENIQDARFFPKHERIPQ